MEPDEGPSYLGQTVTIFEMVGGRFEEVTYRAEWPYLAAEGEDGLIWVRDDTLAPLSGAGFIFHQGTPGGGAPKPPDYRIKHLIKKGPWIDAITDVTVLYDSASPPEDPEKRLASTANFAATATLLTSDIRYGQKFGVASESGATGALKGLVKGSQDYVVVATHGSPNGPGFVRDNQILSDSFYDEAARALTDKGMLILLGCLIGADVNNIKTYQERARAMGRAIAYTDSWVNYAGPTGPMDMERQASDGSWYVFNPNGRVFRYRNDGADPIDVTP
jgi:hypothetical protein